MTENLLLAPEQQTLVDRSHRRLLSILEKHGNKVSEGHSIALNHLLTLMTAQAFGHIHGRFVAPLPTGSGKTTAVAAWITELVQEADTPVCVSMFTIEGLCRLYRDLLDHGLTEADVGIIHSYELFEEELTRGQLPPPGKATVPSLIWDKESKSFPYRQVILVSHTRLRKADLDTFFYVNGGSRALTIFDESLVTSESQGIDAGTLQAAYNAMKHTLEGDKLAPVIEYLSGFAEWYSEGQDANQAQIYRFPDISKAESTRLEKLASTFDSRVTKSKAQREAVTDAIWGTGNEFRLIRSGAPKLVRPVQTFPDEIDNLIVLDASYKRKVAERKDVTLENAQDALTEALSDPVDLTSFKHYDNVTINRMNIPSGRTSIENDLKKGCAKLNEIINLVRTSPPDEGILIFAFKNLRQTDTAEYIRTQLRNSGIDPDAQVEISESLRPRINILTWGQEASLNDFAYCRHVILYGILRRDRAELAAVYFGAKNDLRAEYGPDHLRVHDEAEAAQAAFQAISRGACRLMSNGMANQMTGYVMTDSETIQAFLADLMPGAKFGIWRSTVPHQKTEREQVIDQIRSETFAEFEAQAANNQKRSISSRSLRKRVDPEKKIKKQTWSNYVSAAVRGRFWCKSRSSVIALDPPILLTGITDS